MLNNYSESQNGIRSDRLYRKACLGEWISYERFFLVLYQQIKMMKKNLKSILLFTPNMNTSYFSFKWALWFKYAYLLNVIFKKNIALTRLNKEKKKKETEQKKLCKLVSHCSWTHPTYRHVSYVSYTGMKIYFNSNTDTQTCLLWRTPYFHHIFRKFNALQKIDNFSKTWLIHNELE